jgi:hypothetical protein
MNSASLLRALRRAAAVIGLLFAAPATAHATWSVIAVDLATGRVVIASATCVNNNDAFLMGIQAVIVPGKGVAACQAGVDGTHANQMLVYTELQKGTDPARIIELLSADPAFQSRQFGILDLQGRSAGHSGLSNGACHAGHPGPRPRHADLLLDPGQHPATRRSDPQRRAGVPVHERLAHRPRDGALEIADQHGGDSRCTCPPLPVDGSRPLIACEGRTSYIAYILMSDKTDSNGDSHNNGKYAMYLTVTQPEQGGPNAIKTGENLNPVKTLRLRYDRWRRTQPASFK